MVVYLVWTVFFVFIIYSDRIPIKDRTYFMFANMVMILSMWPVSLFVTRRRMAQVFRELGIRPSHCGRCEYDLRATDSNQCPECGEELVPK